MTPLLIILLSLLALNASQVRADSDTLLIGEVGSMTGSEATFGVVTDNGIQLAIQQINAAGGVLGKKLRVITLDDQGKPDEAATAVTKLVTEDNVIALLGEVSSAQSLAMAPIAQTYHVPMITPSSTNIKVTEQGDYIFRVCFVDPFQGKVMARFASEYLKIHRVAVLRDIKNDYSVGLANFFVKHFLKMGGQIVLDQSYGKGDIDFKAQLTAIRAKNPEAIFLPGNYTEVGLIARQARELGITVPILGGDGWDSPKTTEIGGTAMNNTFFANHYSSEDTSPRVQNFIREYKVVFGVIPDGLAAMGYDSAMVLADAMKRAKTLSRKDIRDALAETKNYPGVTGIITIDKDRNAEKSAVVIKVMDGQFHYLLTIHPDTASTEPQESDSTVATEIPHQNIPALDDENSRATRNGWIEFIQHLINGLSLGSIYALIALGYTMVFGILQLINFAHGDVYMLGAFIGFYLSRGLGLGHSSSFGALLLNLAVAMVGCALIGYVIERGAYRPLRSSPKINVLITAVGVSLFLEFSGQLMFGSDPKFFPQIYSPSGAWSIGLLKINPLQLIVFLISVVLMTALQFIIFKTRLGRAMRAVSFNHETASLMGIPTDKVVSYTFMLGSALAGAAGILVGLIYPKIEPLMGVMPGLKAFVAAVLGGIGSVTGAVVGALTLGLAEELLVGYWAPTYRDALAFAVLILILLFKPMGIFGSKSAEKV